MEKKVSLITGSTSGIGKETARGLANRGGTVILHGRNKERGKKALAEIKRDTDNNSLDLMLVDFSSLKRVREFASDLKEKYERLDVLVNNAGGLFRGRQLSEDGIEMNFAVNHLAHFLLTNLLLGILKQSSPARIVNVASESHSNDIDLDKLTQGEGPGGYRAYKQSKLANILFTYALSRRLQGKDITVNCLHPGAVRTNFGRNYPILDWLWRYLPFLRSAEKGAETVIYLASSPEVKEISGKYFKDKKEIESTPSSYSQDLQEKLWKKSAELTELNF